MVSSATTGCRHSRLASLVAIVFVVCVTHLALSPNNMSKLYETTAVSESKHSLRAVGVQEISSPVPKAPPVWRWVESQEHCATPPLSFTCTPHGWAWRPEGSDGDLESQVQAEEEGRFWEGEEACTLLRERGVRRVAMVGDSYMRHAFEGVAMTLSQDYKAGGLTAEGAGDEGCHGDGQFEEWHCRHYVAQDKTLCNGDVYLERRTNPHWMHLSRDLVEFDAILWNGGEHALGENRTGVNDITVVERVMFENDCGSGHITWLPLSETATEAARAPRLFWLLPHQRLADPSPESGSDETRDMVRTYAKASIPAIHRQCGKGVRIVDAFNVTQALVDALPQEAKDMTWDGAHWGRAVNLIKAQLILRALVAE